MLLETLFCFFSKLEKTGCISWYDTKKASPYFGLAASKVTLCFLICSSGIYF